MVGFFTILIIIFCLYIAIRNVRKQRQQRFKKIFKEIKCTCQACGNIWFYGKQEVKEISVQKLENCGNAMNNAGADMLCCSGCLPAVFIPQRQNIPVKDLNKCPKCNSSAIKKGEIIHEV